MNVVIVRVPTIIDATASTAPICPPIGLAYINAVAKLYCDTIQVVDAVGLYPFVRQVDIRSSSCRILGLSAKEIAERINEPVDLILVSIMFSQDWPYSNQVVSQIKKRFPSTPIVAGGEHITAMPEFTLKDCPSLDLCVLGEGEHTLTELLVRFRKEQVLAVDLEGTCVRAGDGTIKRNPRRARITELQTIPKPDWEGFPMERYLAGGHGFGVNLGRSMPILATRGCPYQCTFCSNPQMWTKIWKAREPEDVFEELQSYVLRYGAENFDFYDLTAIVKRDWTIRFAKLLIQHKLKITWQLPSGTRSEAIDREVAALLYSSGCRNLSFAPETGSEKMLKIIKKRVQLPRMLQSMKDCISEGISVKAHIICGFPDEKYSQLRETFFFIVRMALIGVDDMSITQFSPYPGSELFDRLIQEGRLKIDDQYFSSLAFYSSMSNSRSYGNHLSSLDILIFKTLGTFAFYAISFLRRPNKLIRTLHNLVAGIETTRLEKTLNSYLSRLGFRRT